MVLAVGVIVLAGILYAAKTKPQEAPAVEPHIDIHYHAGFQLYKDDRRVDFSDFKYMKVEPCSLDEHDEMSPEEEQLEKAHMHDGVGDVVHVHVEGSKWGDLFKNIGYEIGEVEGYVNGEKVEDILNYPIQAYDSVVIFEGKNTDIEAIVENRVTKEHMVETESNSENCGS